MSQAIISQQIAKYLDIISSEYIEELETTKITLNNPEAIEQLEKTQKEHQNFIFNLKKRLPQGYCFGFSLCHGAMDISGKLNWWENALVKIYGWDGEKSSLDRKFILPDSINSKPTTLREIFKRIMNYVFPNQTGDEINKDFMPENTHYYNILQPDARVLAPFKEQPEKKQSPFEILFENGEIKTIKKREKMAGNFTEQQLESLLSKKLISDTICLIHSTYLRHTIRLGYKDGKWILYDPNYSHENFSSIHFIGSKKEVINEIFNIFHWIPAIAVEVASVDERKIIDLSVYENIIKTSPISLLQDHGLSVIAQYSPASLLKLLKLADETHEGKAIRSAIAAALVEKTPLDNWIALYIIIFYAPASLPKLFELADETHEGKAIRSAIAAALVEKTIPDNFNALYLIAHNAPASLPKLFELADKTHEGKAIRSAIAAALVEKTISDNWAVLHIIVFYAPASLPKLFELADETYEGKAIRSAIATALVEKTIPDNFNALYLIARNAPASLPKLFKLADETYEGKAIRSAIAAALVEKTLSDNWTVLGIVA